MTTGSFFCCNILVLSRLGTNFWSRGCKRDSYSGRTSPRLVELELKLHFLGAWATSENDFSNSECPKLKADSKASLKSCKVFCLEERRCTAISYDNSTRVCELRDCRPFPIASPREPLDEKSSYWMVSTGRSKQGRHTVDDTVYNVYCIYPITRKQVAQNRITLVILPSRTY